jgi:DNA-directed RNA polymerase beta subunit
MGFLSGTASHPPHKESFELFYGGIISRIKKWLNQLLVQLKNEGKIAFDPAVHIRQIPPCKPPEMDLEQSCRIQGRTLENPFKIEISLDFGREHWDWDLGNFPSMTSRGSFIYKGNEHVIIAQLSNSPGIFFSWEEKNEPRGSVLHKVRYAVTKLRPKDGLHLEFRKEVAPKNGPFRVMFSNQQTAFLENFLRTIGFSEDERKEILIKTSKNEAEGLEEKEEKKASDSFQNDIRIIARSLGLGKELKAELLSDRDQNEKALGEKIQKKFYSLLLGQLGRAQMDRRIRRIDPIFAGTSDTITKEDMAGVLRSFVAFINGEVSEDDPWDLGNLKVRLVGDYLEDALTHWLNWMRLKIQKRVEDEIRKGIRIGAMAMKEILMVANTDTPESTLFSKLIYDWVFRSPMSQMMPKEQDNLPEAASLARKITYSGWGGISVGQTGGTFVQRVHRKF